MIEKYKFLTKHILYSNFGVQGSSPGLRLKTKKDAGAVGWSMEDVFQAGETSCGKTRNYVSSARDTSAGVFLLHQTSAFRGFNTNILVYYM